MPRAAGDGRALATGRELGDHAVQANVGAMGSRAHVVVVGGRPGLVDDACSVLARLEAHWSRFRPDSDVSRLNRAEGSWVSVHHDTMVLLARARTGWRLSAGRFDPTVLPAMLAVGYDTTFTAVVDRARGARHATGSQDVDVATPPRGRSTPLEPGRAPGLGDLHLDWHGGRVRLPAGVTVDPGAIGKGLAADLVVERLLGLGAAGAMANVGGDLRVAGQPPDEDGWGIQVVLPGRGDTVLLSLAEGAVATSTPAYRRWRHHDGTVHHLVDPATGRPARRAATSATVVAGAGWLAEVLATSLVLGGPPDDLAVNGATGLVADETGVHLLPGLQEYVR